MLQLQFFENPRFSAASVAITLVFFALFGTVFLNTQYLQFVLGFTPLEAGFRVMPVATLIVAAPLSARFAERFGTKRVVTTGLRSSPSRCRSWQRSPSTPGTGRVAIALAILGVGMGTTMAPATESIMGSLPLAKAGVGSAMNDTTRQIGGALGVAVLGSILASSFGSSMAPVVAILPAEAARAGDSIGGAAAVLPRSAKPGRNWSMPRRRHSSAGWRSRSGLRPEWRLLGAVITYLFLPARASGSGRSRAVPADDIH